MQHCCNNKNYYYICNTIALSKGRLMKRKMTRINDILGISAATLCLIHCIAFPLLAIIPFGFSTNAYIDLLFVSIAAIVVFKILKSNATNNVKFTLGFSFLMLLIGVLLEILLDLETGLVIVGGLGMIVGHLFNFANHKNQHNCD